jgi:glycosyltransferase involved in cell wall biosynthesis
MARMRVVMVSKAMVVGAYQRKAEELARCGVELTVLIPPAWGDRRGCQKAERQHVQGYDLRVIPMYFSGSYHLHYYPTLAREFAAIQPQLVHMDEEPYNLATWMGLRAAARRQAPGLFFTWQNLYRRYPPPFRWLEQANYRRARIAIAGNHEAAAVLRRKGYRGKIAIIPQFGVDPTVFVPPARAPSPGTLRIGYAGGYLPEKGLDLLLHACGGLGGDWRLHMVGDGDERPRLARLAEELRIGDRVCLDRRFASTEMPGFYQALDVFVLPSRSTPTWKEQFGRVLIEAMACEVAVVGSSSGLIPHVIGEAGLIFDEGDAIGLRQALQSLQHDPELRRELGASGRQRVLERYTMAQVAAQTVHVYRALLDSTPLRVVEV